MYENKIRGKVCLQNTKLSKDFYHVFLIAGSEYFTERGTLNKATVSENINNADNSYSLGTFTFALVIVIEQSTYYNWIQYYAVTQVGKL